MKKGFTLVETLAVITVIVLLGLITIPAITKSLEKNEQKVFKETVEQIVESVKIYRADYEIVDDTMSVDIIKNKNIEFAKKNKILNGQVVLENSKYKVINITNGDYCANGYLDNLQITKGSCGIDFNSRYVYFQSDGEFTSLEQTTPTIPTGYNIYLKIDKNDITNAQVCLNFKGTELCLNPSDNSVEQKILDYFEYDSTTWTQNETVWSNGDEMCNIIAASESMPAITLCSDQVVQIINYSGMSTSILDSATNFACGMSTEGNGGCSSE